MSDSDTATTYVYAPAFGALITAAGVSGGVLRMRVVPVGGAALLVPVRADPLRAHNS